MTEIRRTGPPTILSALTLAANRISGSAAGESIRAGDACYLSGDGRVYRSLGAARGEAADVRGFAMADAAPAGAVTLAFDVTMRYGEDLPPGESLYLSGTVPGGLADFPSPGISQPVAFVVDATAIHVLQS